jgi:hypothetical protein
MSGTLPGRPTALNSSGDRVQGGGNSPKRISRTRDALVPAPHEGLHSAKWYDSLNLEQHQDPKILVHALSQPGNWGEIIRRPGACNCFLINIPALCWALTSVLRTQQIFCSTLTTSLQKKYYCLHSCMQSTNTCGAPIMCQTLPFTEDTEFTRLAPQNLHRGWHWVKLNNSLSITSLELEPRPLYSFASWILLLPRLTFKFKQKVSPYEKGVTQKENK